jgi:hypothetical protein
MRNQQLKWTAGGAVVLVAAVVAFGGRSAALAHDRDRGVRDRLPDRFTGLLNDHTPSNAVTKGGPYEMRAKWSLELDERRGTATFEAAMDMSTSDYGIIQNTVDKDNPASRGAHTHHISMTDGVLSTDWASQCPIFSPATTEGFVITGTAFVTGNGSPAPFGNPSPFTVCILGGESVQYSNITVKFGAPASNHFGTQAIHGVILRCTGHFLRESPDCALEQ